MELTKLTASEARLISMVVGGLTNNEIAAALGFELEQVEISLDEVCRKLGLRSRTELAVLFGSTGA